MKETWKIEGFVAPGFEPVKSTLLKVLEERDAKQTQVCVYMDGKLVVDLVGKLSDDKLYTHTSIQNVFSCSKVVSSIIVAMLVDRGLLQFDSPISKYWPEFGEKGKESITISDLMRHEGGLHRLPFTLEAWTLQRDQLKKYSISRLIASSDLKRRSKSAEGTLGRAYHSLSRDVITNEIVMRVDPQGRTIGQFLAEEVAGPLGLGGQITLGTETGLVSVSDRYTESPAKNNTDEVLLFPLRMRPLSWLIFQLFNPFRPAPLLGLIVHILFIHLSYLKHLQHLLLSFASPLTGKRPPPYTPELVPSASPSPPDSPPPPPSPVYLHDLFNHSLIRTAELPSANVHASARSLARLGSEVVMSQCEESDKMRNDDEQAASELDSSLPIPLLSSSSFKLTHSSLSKKRDSLLQAHTLLSPSGLCCFCPDQTPSFAHSNLRQGSYGWFGIGGSAMQWHPALRLSFAYTTPWIHPDLMNLNSALVQNEVLNCARRLRERDAALPSSEPNKKQL